MKLLIPDCSARILLSEAGGPKGLKTLAFVLVTGSVLNRNVVTLG